MLISCSKKMDCCIRLPYSETGYFSPVVTAYIENDERLKDFLQYPVSLQGIKDAIRQRKEFTQNRQLLVSFLQKQYEGLPRYEQVTNNIKLLEDEKTFTICSAHQPAIFTGTLFFIYKILHSVKLAATLKQQLPEYNFVPVFYMGSEDADLDELGHIYLNGEKITWDTNQKGAIGRMQPKGLEKIIDRLEGELTVLPNGGELIQLIRKTYLESQNIQEATLKLIHHLFGEYGLLVLIPDDPLLKKEMLPVFEDELFNQVSAGLVQQSGEKLGQHFKVQAHPRDINLFYLKDNMRERIVREEEGFVVVNTAIHFTADEIKKELRDHPERFSPNVILRGLFQETLLPNIAFIGGGGELAYWLELKNVFNHYKVPYPVLILRNSFLVMDETQSDKLKKLGLSIYNIFKPAGILLNELVKRESSSSLKLTKEIQIIEEQYQQIKQLAGNIDPTLKGHVDALKTKSIQRLAILEKKMLRAEKKKFAVQSRQINMIKEELFPNNSLQERMENFMPFYARWGKEFIETIYKHSLALEQEFTVITYDH